ncbi:MAG TPA: cupin domain-containing protein [Puia sp.]|nr:cupin domain-containing protein [Puia sp.]
MKTELPLTIENKTGEQLTFQRITVKEGIEYLEVENKIQPDAGPPMHVHYQQDELISVISGKMEYWELNGEKKYAGAGDSVFFKAGIPHKFRNAGSEILHCSGYYSPACNTVYFLSEIYKSINENNGRPGIYDAAYLLEKYKSEFGLLEVPQFVQKTIFPFVLWLGTRTGMNKKFANAPSASKK